MSTELDRISELAKEDAKRQFCSIAHMIKFGALYAAFRGLRKKASAGVDGVTYEQYERDVAGNLQTLHERLKDGKYQAQPLRRVYILLVNGVQYFDHRLLHDLVLQSRFLPWRTRSCRRRWSKY